MEEYPAIPMERTGKLLRRSICTYLNNYQYFATTAALLAFPFSAATLFSQALLPFSTLLPVIYSCLQSLFTAAGFPPSSEFFTMLALKLSQTIASSILVLPFTFSFYLMAKTFVIQALTHKKPSYLPSFLSFTSTFFSIVLTQICNSFLILSANAACFFLLFFAFNFLEGFGFSSPNSILFLSASGAVLYSIVIAHALIISNLALISSGMTRIGGYLPILRACVLIRGKTATALALALPVNMAMAAAEALFHYRVLRAYHNSANLTASMALEGIFIACLYSTILVLDTVVSCVFFRSCKEACQMDLVEIEEQRGSAFVNMKTLEDLI